MTNRVTYYVKKIETGYTVSYYFEGDEIIRAFKDWKETLDFLKDNPPKVFEAITTTDYVELDND